MAHAPSRKIHNFFSISVSDSIWQKYTNSQEHDEGYVPNTRSDLNLPEEHSTKPTDYAELLEDAPFYMLYRLIQMQLAGFQHYLLFHTSGSKAHPSGTNVSGGLLQRYSKEHSSHMASSISPRVQHCSGQKTDRSLLHPTLVWLA
jgi:hypothetical protein